MTKHVRILLVEDNPADADLTRESLDATGLAHTLDVVVDGVQALQYLRRQGAHADASQPDLVVLDLNLPRKDGREVLAEMKADPTMRRIPVVVLSSSKADDDVARSYDLSASAYLTKPVDLDGYARVARGIAEFWGTVVRFATHD